MPSAKEFRNELVDVSFSIQLGDCSLLSDEEMKKIAKRMDLLGRKIVNKLFALRIFRSWLIATLTRIVEYPKSGKNKFRGDKPKVSVEKVRDRIAALADTKKPPHRASDVELALKFSNYEHFVRHLQRRSGNWKTTAQWTALMKHWTEWNNVREMLINAHLRLAVDVAKKYRDRGLTFADLIQEAALGLTRCISNFEFRRGYQVSTFVTPWIHQSIQEAIKKKKRNIRLPSYADGLLSRYRTAENQLKNELGGRQLTIEEVCEHCGLNAKKLRFILAASTQHSLDELPKGDHSRTVEAILACAVEDSPLEQRELIAKMRQRYEELYPHEKQIIQSRYGLQSGQPKSLIKIGEEFNLSKERIRQIQARALEKMRLGMQSP